MSVGEGDSIGPYTVESEIGRGGMGVVYKGTDTRLDRAVAIKSLPEHFADNPERLARFEREAKTLASLNHPNVAGIYGVEEHDGARYLILEFVEGQTLADRIQAGPMSVHDTLEICAQVAAGLEAAHEAGVIHRDLKPDNIRITPEGVAKVLDFGLARADEVSSSTGSSVSQMPTITSPHSPTVPGAILGTAPYMSPEQARGKTVDKRTDIWSFGVVLYECLTGISPFRAETISDSISLILQSTPDLDQIPVQTPAHVRHVLDRCLERDKAKRWRDIGDVRMELERSLADSPAVAATGRFAVRPGAPIVLAVLLVIVIVGGGGWLVGSRGVSDPAPVVRKFEIPLVHTESYGAGRPAISPDGRTIAYMDEGAIWVRDLDSFDKRRIDGSDGGAAPFWSPDGQWLGFGRGTELVKVPIDGGRPIVITEATASFSIVAGMQWSPDDTIYWTTGDSGIFSVSAAGGLARPYLSNDVPGVDDFHELTLLPDGKTIVFTVHSHTRPWYLASFDGETMQDVVSIDGYHLMNPSYSPTGHILFQRFGDEDSVWAVPFSSEQNAVTGPPFLVSMDDGHPNVGASGTLVLTRRVVGLEGGDLVSVDLQTGQMSVLAEIAGQYYDPVYSPDGSMFALVGFSPSDVSLWVIDSENLSRTRLTLNQAKKSVRPQWSPDGAEIAYTRTSGSTFDRIGVDDSIHFISSDGAGETREPIDGGYIVFDKEWNTAACVRFDEATHFDIWALPMDGSSSAHPIVATAAREEQPALSPDGRFLAYVSDESGEQEVYLTRFPSGEGKWQVTTGLGLLPTWSPDGERLFYVDSEVTVHEVEVVRDERVRIGQPSAVVMGLETGINPMSGFSVSPDGGSLIGIRATGTDEPPAIGVIENWFEVFREQHGR